MTGMCLRVVNKDDKTVAVSSGEDEVNLVYSQEYVEGDKISLEIEAKQCFVWLLLDDALGKSLVYVTGNLLYTLPFGEKRNNMSPKVFFGKCHLLSAKIAQEHEIKAYRNLAINICDQHQLYNCYPHAAANVETRGEAVFAAQNAIDGVTINTGHGPWPYQSWGINKQEDAKLRIDFGRNVMINKIILYTRADFPHDNWWEEVSFCFSDCSELKMHMEKNRKPHIINFDAKTINWLEMRDMKKSNDPSPFPALTQIEVYGNDI